MNFLIANLYGTAGTAWPRPLVTVSAQCNMSISNHYSHSTSNYPDFLLNHPSAILTLNNFRSLFYTTSVAWAQVQQGFLRIFNGVLLCAGPRTVAAIAETLSGNLLVENVTIANAGGSTSGPLISVVTNSPHSSIGALTLDSGSAWTFSLPAGLVKTIYSQRVALTGVLSLLALPGSTTYANDAAAATGGVAVGQLYRNGSAVQVRVS